MLSNHTPARPDRPRILVVDDEAAIRVLLSAVFSGAGYEVQTAADVAEAMRLCAAGSFHLVLSDVRKSGPNGHDLARWLAEHCPSVRWVLMTGFQDECSMCPLASGCRYLRKPFGASDALAAVQAALIQ